MLNVDRLAKMDRIAMGTSDKFWYETSFPKDRSREENPPIGTEDWSKEAEEDPQPAFLIPEQCTFRPNRVGTLYGFSREVGLTESVRVQEPPIMWGERHAELDIEKKEDPDVQTIDQLK